ncbi:DUF3592 domain-containing protein [Spirosoma soli]|uniref:DUF3592 domain-containing protein n=1 Tax=Spirosoma soli TaxID=1770529 RepID=A0ABW5M3P7_9BACT
MGYSITFFVGILVLLASLYLFNTAIDFIKTGTRTMAVVEDLVRVNSKKGKSTYRPIFRYTTLTGKEIHYSHSVSSSPPDWAVGEKATLVYKLDDPENPMILTYFSAFGSAIISLAIATALLIIGGGYYVFQWYAKQFLL